MSKEKPYEPPFRLDPNVGWIFDTNGMHVLDVRGWGALTGNPHRIPEDKACDVQDAFGEKVCRVLNAGWRPAGHCVKCDLDLLGHTTCQSCGKKNL